VHAYTHLLPCQPVRTRGRGHDQGDTGERIEIKICPCGSDTTEAKAHPPGLEALRGKGKREGGREGGRMTRRIRRREKGRIEKSEGGKIREEGRKEGKEGGGEGVRM